MIKAARSESLKFALENHLEETKEQVERLKEVFTLIGEPAKGKTCKGMAGLLEEGNEVIEEANEQGDAAAADLALIAAAQKVEHYEISAYGTARTMAGQIGLPAVATLLNRSLAEEEIADNLMTQLARELMSESRTGMTKEPETCANGSERGREVIDRIGRVLFLGPGALPTDRRLLRQELDYRRSALRNHEPLADDELAQQLGDPFARRRGIADRHRRLLALLFDAVVPT